MSGCEGLSLIAFLIPDWDQACLSSDYKTKMAVPSREKQDFHRWPRLHVDIFIIHQRDNKQFDEPGHAVQKGNAKDLTEWHWEPLNCLGRFWNPTLSDKS